MNLWICGFFMAWGMFLSIPCPVRKWDERARGRMLVCFVLIGCIIGGLWALALFALRKISCPAPLSALALTALPWLLSGFIHLDGFMDVCDAVLSRRDIETRRKILKDPHCGAFGVICLVLVVISAWSLFFARDVASLDMLSLALIPVASRASAGLAMLLLPRLDGSQYAETEAKKAYLIIPLCVMLAAAAAVPAAMHGYRGLAPAAAAVGYWFFVWRGEKQLGGVSGDVSGFALTLSELIGVAILTLVR